MKNSQIKGNATKGTAKQKNHVSTIIPQEKQHIALPEFQQQIQKSIISSSLQEQQLNLINEEIKPSPRMSAIEHFAIYRRSYVIRLEQCMDNQFSALKYALGDDLFHLFVSQYLHTYPSKHYSLNNLGDNFSQFLQETRPDAEQENKETWINFIIELTEFEYSINTLFDLEIPNTPLDHLQTPANIRTDNEQMQLVPIIKLFEHQYPIINYYNAFNNNLNPELALPKKSYGMIIRRNYRLGLIDVNQGQYLFLTALLKEQCIEKAKQVLIANKHFTQEEINTLWSHWKKYLIEKGVFNVST